MKTHVRQHILMHFQTLLSHRHVRTYFKVNSGTWYRAKANTFPVSSQTDGGCRCLFDSHKDTKHASDSMSKPIRVVCRKCRCERSSSVSCCNPDDRRGVTHIHAETWHVKLGVQKIQFPRGHLWWFRCENLQRTVYTCWSSFSFYKKLFPIHPGGITQVVHKTMNFPSEVFWSSYKSMPQLLEDKRTMLHLIRI